MQLRAILTGAASTVTVIATAASLFVPALASADTINPTLSVQQLMQGAPACNTIQVEHITPYLYEGALNSFDVTISDPSFVVIGGSAGATPIPLTLVSRWMGQGNTVRMHVDVASLPINGTMPLSLTMLSAQPGRGICAATVTFSVTAPGNTAPAVTQTQNVPHPTQTQEGNRPRSSSDTSKTATSTGSAATGTPAVSGSIIATPFSNVAASVTSLCATGQGVSQLWLVLLSVYFALVLTAVLANIPALRSSKLAAYSLVLVPLLVLAAFWYLLPMCRAVPWIGLAAVIIAIGGMIGLAQGEREEGEVAVSSMPMLPQTTAVVSSGTPSMSATSANNSSSGNPSALSKNAPGMSSSTASETAKTANNKK